MDGISIKIYCYVNMQLLSIIRVFFSLVSISNASGLLISSNTPYPKSVQLAEYKGKYISIIDSETVYTASKTSDVVITDNSNISINNSTYFQPTQLWNLDIMDNLTNGYYSYSYTGENVIAYVIDSGITQDAEFENRILKGMSFNPYGNLTNDCLGHGSHVASLIGSKTYGVAKRVKIVPVKVFDCIGTTLISTIIQAIYWVIKQPKGIVNLSIGGSYNPILNRAIIDLIDAGFIVVVAAGNNGGNACDYSPSSESSAIVVGCFNALNGVCSYSNEGNCVTLYAPGDSILGVRNTGGVVSKSGTSMASPHASGVAATVYQKYPGIIQSDMKKILISMSTGNTLSGFKSPIVSNLALRGIGEDIPKCFGLSKTLCGKNRSCTFIKNYGCRAINFCGFIKRQECVIRKRCKYVSGKCQLR
jgi:subtilisin family serine protease